ncbi:Uncharacterised protein [uncultured archaeon]|nr:Uncharacterised protein [uncultured archaeon]
MHANPRQPVNQRAFARTISFGEDLNDFGGSAGPEYYDLSREYEKDLLPKLLESGPLAQTTLDLIRRPPAPDSDLSLSPFEHQLVSFSRRLRNVDLMEGFMKCAQFLTTLDHDTNEYRQIARRFGIKQPEATNQQPEVPAPKQITSAAPQKIDSHGRTATSLD